MVAILFQFEPYIFCDLLPHIVKVYLQNRRTKVRARSAISLHFNINKMYFLSVHLQLIGFRKKIMRHAVGNSKCLNSRNSKKWKVIFTKTFNIYGGDIQLSLDLM